MTRILVVEDSFAMAHMLHDLWTAHGHTVRSVTEDFEQLLLSTPLWREIDMLVTDLDLGRPDISGLDILRHAAAQHPLVRRRVLSGALKSSHLYEPALQLAQVLPKPTELDELLKAAQL